MKYQKITQKPYCCVGACLEMVLRRRGITDYHQEEIAAELGLIVPEEYKDRLPMARVGKMPAAGYGTQIQEERHSINHLIIFHCATLYDAPEADWGHMVLLDHIDDDRVMIQENSPKRDLETVDLEKLLHAIEVHGRGNGAGFYLIS